MSKSVTSSDVTALLLSFATILNRISVGIALLIVAPVTAGEESVDDFRGAELEGRQAERGEWQFHNGVASCVADPVL